MKKYQAITAACLMGGLVLAAGCSSNDGAEKGKEITVTDKNKALASELNDAPKWVRIGKDGDNKKRICGVGSISGTNNVEMARTAAEARGRNKIAQFLQTEVAVQYKDALSNVAKTGKDTTKASDEQAIQQATMQFTNKTLSGVSLEDTWVSPNGNFYSLMCLDLDTFKEQLSGYGEIDTDVKQGILERAEKMWDSLDEKLRGAHSDKAEP